MMVNYRQTNDNTFFVGKIRDYFKNEDFPNLLSYVEIYCPNIFVYYPKVLFILYKWYFMILKKSKNFVEAERIFNHFILPSYKKSTNFRQKINVFTVILRSQNTNNFEITSKIDKYTEKVLFLIQNILIAEFNSIILGKQLNSNLMTQTNSVCHDRHLEILNKMELNEDDSSLSDMEEEILKTCQKGFNGFINNTLNVEDDKVSELKNNTNNIINNNITNNTNISKQKIFLVHHSKEINNTRTMNVIPQQNYDLLHAKDHRDEQIDHIRKESNITKSSSVNACDEFMIVDEQQTNCHSNTIASSDIINKNKYDINNEIMTDIVMEKFESDEERAIVSIMSNKMSKVNNNSYDYSNNYQVLNNTNTDILNFDNFQNIVDMSQQKKVFQPLKNIGYLNYTKNVSDKMEVDTADYEISEHSIEISRKESLVVNNINNLYKQKSSIYSDIDPLVDPSSNLNAYKKQFVPKLNQSKEKLKNLVPFLKEFNPKFLKKENIDKKILRKFRNFVKSIWKADKIYFDSIDKQFWNNFCSMNLLPPMRYVDSDNNLVEFKSFNTNFMLWLFSKCGTDDLYREFTIKSGQNILQNFIDAYDLINNKEEIDVIVKLQFYIANIPEIYSSLASNNSYSNNNTHSLTFNPNYKAKKTYNNKAMSDITFAYANGKRYSLDESSIYDQLKSEEILDNYIGAYETKKNTAFDLANFETPYKRCGKLLKFEEDQYGSYLDTVMNRSYDSIASVE